MSPTYLQVAAAGVNATPATLTVTGTNFGAAAEVSLGGGFLPIVSQSSTQIVAMVSLQSYYPAGAVPVVVYHPAPSVAGSPLSSTPLIASAPASLNVLTRWRHLRLRRGAREDEQRAANVLLFRTAER